MTYTLPRGYLSPSAINRFRSCGRCYEMKYVLGLSAPVDAALPIGGAIHYGIEHMRRMLLEGIVADSEEVLDAAVEHFNDAVKREDIDYGTSSEGESRDTVAKTTRYLIPRMRRIDEQRGLVAVELDLDDFHEQNPWPFPIKGRVDALYGPGPGLVNLGSDLKSSGKQVPPTEGNKIQAGIYREIVGVPWIIDQITKTKNPVLTQFELGEDTEDYVFDTVMGVAEDISAGIFRANPSYLCDFPHGGPSFTIVTADYKEGAA